jgi:hypothetical protein
LGITTSFSVSPTTIHLGQSVTAQWSVHRPTGCFGSSSMLLGPGAPATTFGNAGSVTFAPPSSGTPAYQLKVSITGGWLMTSPQPVTVQPFPQMPAVAVARNTDGRLELGIADGANLDHVLRRRQTAPSAGFAALTLGADSMHSLAAETNSDGRVELFGTDVSGRVFHQWQTTPGSESWSEWQQLDGVVFSVAAARNADGRLSLFGSNASGQVFYRTQVNAGSTTMGGWSQLDGTLRQVAADTNADGRIELFGLTDGGQIWHRWQTAPNSTSWSAWSQLDGTLSALAVARDADGRMELIGGNNSGSMFERAQSSPGSSTWTGWAEQLGGVSGSVAAETNSDGRVEIVGQAVIDGTLQQAHRAQTDPGTAAWTGWVPLDRRVAPHLLLVACLNNSDCRQGDVNGDRVPDLVTYVRAQGDVMVSLGNLFSPGDYAPAQRWATQLCFTGIDCELGDVTGDKADDVVVFDRSTGAVRVAMSARPGFIVSDPGSWSTAACLDASICRLADMNNDGKADVVSFFRDSHTALGSGKVSVLLSDGHNFGQAVQWSDQVCPVGQDCLLGDVDGDGLSDAVSLVTGGDFKGTVWVARNMFGSFAAPQTWTSDSKCVDDSICAVFDVNNDQKFDLVAKSPSDSDTQVLASTSTGHSFNAAQVLDPQNMRTPRAQGTIITCGSVITNIRIAQGWSTYWWSVAHEQKDSVFVPLMRAIALFWSDDEVYWTGLLYGMHC